MLVAERNTRAFQRIDGGDGILLQGRPTTNANEPPADTPMRVWNMVLPIVALVIFFLLVFGAYVQIDGTEYETYSALVVSIASATLVTQAFYSFQFKT
jgi:hypothetical protein